MQITKDLVNKLRQVKEEKHLSLSNILDLIEQNGEYVSKTSLSRIFSEDSETQSFKPETILPIAKVLLDVETLEETDTLDEQALKTLSQFKGQRISELEQQIEHLQMELATEKLRHHEKRDKERAEAQRKADFLIRQIEYKDTRIDKLMDALFEKDQQYNDLLAKLMSEGKI